MGLLTTLGLIVAVLVILTAPFLLLLALVASVGLAIGVLAAILWNFGKKSRQLWEDYKNQIGFLITEFINNTIILFLSWSVKLSSVIYSFTSSTITAIMNWTKAFIDQITKLRDGVVAKLQEIGRAILDSINNAINSIKNSNFYQAGLNIVYGIRNGIRDGAWAVVDAIQSMASDAWDAVSEAFDSHSPSRLMMQLGVDIDKGLAMGITNFSGVVENAMSNMASSSMAQLSSMPSTAANSVSNTTYQNTNSFDLTINSNAKTEPIIQDFNMMRSIIGA